MAIYAVVVNTFVVNTVEAEEDYAVSKGWILIPPSFGIGDWYIQGEFKKTQDLSIPSTNTGNL